MGGMGQKQSFPSRKREGVTTAKPRKQPIAPPHHR